MPSVSDATCAAGMVAVKVWAPVGADSTAGTVTGAVAGLVSSRVTATAVASWATPEITTAVPTLAMLTTGVLVVVTPYEGSGHEGHVERRALRGDERVGPEPVGPDETAHGQAHVGGGQAGEGGGERRPRGRVVGEGAHRPHARANAGADVAAAVHREQRTVDDADVELVDGKLVAQGVGRGAVHLDHAGVVHLGGGGHVLDDGLLATPAGRDHLDDVLGLEQRGGAGEAHPAQVVDLEQAGGVGRA